jgi:flagellar protein FliJ
VFRFRFEALLNARRHAEECLQKELAEARRALAAEQAALRQKKHARRQCVQDQLRKQRQGFRGPDMLLFEAYRQRLERDIEEQQKRVAAAERTAAQKRHALLEAVKKRRMLDKLKEKDLEQHLRTLAERERKFMDEVAVRRHSAARPV